jgi:hypothetical protein
VEDIFSDPSSLECAHRVNEIADKNWEVFSSEAVADMDSHILRLEDKRCVLRSIDAFQVLALARARTVRKHDRTTLTFSFMRSFITRVQSYHEILLPPVWCLQHQEQGK